MQQRTLEVDLGALDERAEVGAPQSFRGDSDLEPFEVLVIMGKFGDGETGPVDADAVTKVGVTEDGGCVGYCKGRSAGTCGGGVERDELGDGLLKKLA